MKYVSSKAIKRVFMLTDKDLKEYRESNKVKFTKINDTEYLYDLYSIKRDKNECNTI